MPEDRQNIDYSDIIGKTFDNMEVLEVTGLKTLDNPERTKQQQISFSTNTNAIYVDLYAKR